MINFSACNKCGSYDIDVIKVSHFNEDTQMYELVYGIQCAACGNRTPVEYTSIEEAFIAWELEVNVSDLN